MGGEGVVSEAAKAVIGEGVVCNWASVSEPHTCDFNATFSLYIYVIYLSICDRHCTSKIAIYIFRYFI